METVNSMEIDDDEWELINDDGFVYKRLKRPRLEPTTSAATPPDPAVEERNRRERKRTTLLRLKTRYQQEINQWEHLSNTLQALQARTQNQPPPTTFTGQPVSLSTEQSSNSTSRELVDTLLVQVETQEATITQLSTLCDVAEALCNAQEERMKQPFLDLPIWESSPRELMKALCDE